jgi:hypothetical protein
MAMHKLVKDLHNDNLLDLVPIDFGGGCSLSKADLMSFLIAKFNIKESIDIGVYRGRSLIPQANAHKKKTQGIVYGIDPYVNELVKENDNKESKKAIDAFIAQNDFGKIFKDVQKLLSTTGLASNSKLIRKTSGDAASYFVKNNIRPRLIHIDGNHDTKIVIEDVHTYADILGQNGFIVMDDVSWNSVKPALDLLHALDFQLVFCRVDNMNDYSVFTNIKSTRLNQKISSYLFSFGQY